MTSADGKSTTRRVAIISAVHIDWSQFEGAGALRCTAGVAIPLAAGLLFDQPSIGAFGAIGAVSVGFGSFQGAYRSRAAVMLWAALAMGVSLFAGSLAGASDAGSIAVATVIAFASSIAVALGPAATFVGLQAIVAALIASGFPASPREAALRAAMVVGGGIAQTLLVVLIWPLRRFSAERAALADVYRSLATYAAAIPHQGSVPPEPHTFAGTREPLADPQPFARAGDVLVFQALLDGAERIRTSLAALVARQSELGGDAACRQDFFDATANALGRIADALRDGRDPQEAGPIWERLDACARALPSRVVIEALLGQLRAAWRMAGVLGTNEADPAPPQRLPPLRRRPPIRDALTTLRANMTPRSSAFRHALRVTAAVAISMTIQRLAHMPRGYWMPMTAALVLRPEFHDTFSRGLARIAGTIGGAALATLIVETFAPGHGATAGLMLAFVWGGYALFRINYAIFTVCLTAYVVFLLVLSGIGEMTAATLRAAYTLSGGLIAIAVYAAWPTWAGATARGELARMLRAHSAYVDALLGAYAEPARLDLHRIGAIRAAARLARSNAEAVIERMLAEPPRYAALPPRVAIGILAALRRHALAAMALHAGLERGVETPVPGIAPLQAQTASALTTLAAALESGTPPAPLPDLRGAQLALGASDALVNEETDLMVDSVNTIASLLSPPRQDML